MWPRNVPGGPRRAARRRAAPPSAPQTPSGPKTPSRARRRIRQAAGSGKAGTSLDLKLLPPLRPKVGTSAATGEELERARELASAILGDPRTPLPPAVVLVVGLIRGRG